MIGMPKEKRTYQDRKEYIKKAVTERRRKLKQMAVEYKGSKCVCCGYNKYIGALEFHHTDPDGKDFAISANGTCRSWDKIKEEIDKCILVCSNCHKEIHAGVRKYSSVAQLEGQQAVNLSQVKVRVLPLEPNNTGID